MQFKIISAAVMALCAAAPVFAQDVDVSGVSRLDAAGQFNLFVTVGGPASFRMDGEADELEKIKVRVRDGELELDGKSRRFLFFGGGRIDVDVHVTLAELTGVDMARGVNAVVEGVNAETFAIDASTGAELDITGTCGSLSVDISTGADIDAYELVCRNVFADASTGGDAQLHATESVVAEASTGGDLSFRGGASKVDKSSSTGGDITLR